MKEQSLICPLCNEALPEWSVVLDRTRVIDGYTAENTQLIYAECGTTQQAATGYS